MTDCRLILNNGIYLAAPLSPLSCTSLTREIDAFYPRDDDSFSVDEAIEMQHELNVEAMPSREIVPSWMTRHSIEGACIPDISKFIESQTVLHLVARCGGKKSLRIRQHIIALDKKKEAKRHAIMVISARQVHAINMTSEFNRDQLDIKCYLDRKKNNCRFFEHDRIVVSLESLGLVPSSFKPDIMVLDELRTIASNTDSKTLWEGKTNSLDPIYNLKALKRFVYKAPLVI